MSSYFSGNATFTLPNSVIDTIFKQLPNKDRLQARYINRSCNAAFKSNACIKNYIFTVDGSDTSSTSTSLAASLQTLIDSSIRWQHIRFKRVQLETQLLGNELGFLFFTRKYCPTLKSMTFEHCRMRMGRFIELLTFCKNLTHLHIVNCSSLFNTNFEITNWAKFYNQFFARLELLQGLEIVDQNSMVTDETLVTWTIHMKNLQSLKIHTGVKNGSKFPKWGIFRAILNNKDTLTSLDLFGVSKTGISLWKLMLKKICVPTRLETLKLRNVKLQPEAMVQETWRQFVDLKHLVLNHIKLPDVCFLKLNEYLRSLEFVSITFCGVAPLVLDNLAQCKTIKSITFIQNTSINDSFRIFEGYSNFFKNTSTAHLEEVTLKAFGSGNLIPEILSKRPHLKSLDISEIQGIKKFHLPLRAVRKTLKCLRMKGCDVNDDSFVGNPKHLSHLLALETLDLSGTEVGDRTVRNCILKLRKLNHLDLSLTNVSSEILNIISSSCPKNV